MKVHILKILQRLLALGVSDQGHKRLSYLWRGKSGPTEHDDDEDNELTGKHHGVHINSARTDLRIINTTEESYNRKTKTTRKENNKNQSHYKHKVKSLYVVLQKHFKITILKFK